MSDNASLYQGILRYAKDHSSNDGNDGFLFTDMGNWLIKTLLEFQIFYTGNKARTTKSTKLENRRDRIQGIMGYLIMMDLLHIIKYIPSKKNQKEKIPVYKISTEGQFLTSILEARDKNKSYDLMWLIKNEDTEQNKTSTNNTIDESRSQNIIQVFETVNTYTHCKESFILSFLSIFFKKCYDNNLFTDIIDRFYYSDLRHTKINKGQELIRLFTKINHPLQWIFVYPNLFIETLSEIDNETKKMLLFNFKMEIEEYYDLYYLASYPRRQTYSELHSLDSYYEHTMAIPGIEWQLLRFNNIHNHLFVTIPGICLKCKSESPFIMDIEDYFDNLKELSNDFRRENIPRSCIKCKVNSVIGKIYIPLDMVRGHEMI